LLFLQHSLWLLLELRGQLQCSISESGPQLTSGE
jgi:hypothetical protein